MDTAKEQQPYKHQVQVKQEARSEFDAELPMEELQKTMEDASSSKAIKEAFVHRPPPVCIIPRMPKVRLVFQDIRKKSTKESIKKRMRIAKSPGNVLISFYSPCRINVCDRPKMRYFNRNFWLFMSLSQILFIYFHGCLNNECSNIHLHLPHLSLSRTTAFHAIVFRALYFSF
jgi:hypothetical protein